MHNETLEKLTNAAKNKINMLNNSKLKYLVSSAFAGLYVGLGIILIFTVGGLLSAADSPMTKIMMGLSFAVALCLVVMTGSELFTGNNMVMSAGMLNKGVSGKSVAKVWMYSYIGNLLGSLLVVAFFVGSGLVDKGPVMEFFATTSIAKASAPAMHLFFRGVLCNILVCSGVLAAYKLKDDTAKLIILFLTLFAFVTSGFEHCIANMITFATCILSGATSVTISGMVYNLFFVTLGNMVGGILFLGAGTYFLGKSGDKKETKMDKVA